MESTRHIVGINVVSSIIDWILVNVDLTVRQYEKLFLWNERSPNETSSRKMSCQKIIFSRLAFPFRFKAMASEQSLFSLWLVLNTCIVGSKRPSVNIVGMYLYWSGFFKEAEVIKCVCMFVYQYLSICWSTYHLSVNLPCERNWFFRMSSCDYGPGKSEFFRAGQKAGDPEKSWCYSSSPKGKVSHFLLRPSTDYFTQSLLI